MKSPRPAPSTAPVAAAPEAVLRVTRRRRGSQIVVALSGQLTATRGEHLLAWLCTAPCRSARELVLDLSAVVAIDRAGAEALVDVCVATTLRATTLTFTGVTTTVRDALRDVGVLHIVQRFEPGPMMVAPAPGNASRRTLPAAFRLHPKYH